MDHASGRLQRLRQIAHRDRNIPCPILRISVASMNTSEGSIWRKWLSIFRMALEHSLPGLNCPSSSRSNSQKNIFCGIWSANTRTPRYGVCPRTPRVQVESLKAEPQLKNRGERHLTAQLVSAVSR